MTRKNEQDLEMNLEKETARNVDLEDYLFRKALFVRKSGRIM